MLEVTRVRLGGSEAGGAKGVDPLGVFAAAADSDFRCFWHSPEERRTIVGVGVAAEWTGSGGSELFQDAQAFVDELDWRGDTPLLFGGFAFSSAAGAAFVGDSSEARFSETSSAENPPQAAQRCDNIWSGFPSGRLVLPEVLLIFSEAASDGADSDKAVEAILCGDESENLLRSLLSNAGELAERESHLQHSSNSRELAASFASADSDTASSYRKLLHEAVDAVGSDELEKVVVATQVKHSLGTAPEDVLRRLCERSRNSTVFAFSSVAVGDNAARSNVRQSVFAGASPELLAAKSGGCFTSMALAGSKPLDEASLLLKDKKELAEHQFVVDHLRNRLEKAGVELAPTGAAGILRLANIAHLCSCVSGRTSDGILKLVENLHPSPAVAGVPTDAALAFLNQHEHFDRGWYAGPVGWLTPDGDGRFYVALRSVLLSPDECHLFAGSGIVKGSSPDREEQETRLKLQTAMEALMPAQMNSPVASSLAASANTAQLS